MRVTTIKGESIDLVPGVKLVDAMLRNLDLSDVDLTGSSLRECYFNESNLSGASLRSCDLTGSVFYRANLVGADLTGATLERCYWNEVIHDETTVWPRGFTVPTGVWATKTDFDSVPVEREPTGLCTPGVVPLATVTQDEVPSDHFVPAVMTVGDIDPSGHETLLLRLAALVFTAHTMDDNMMSDPEWFVFERHQIGGTEDDEDVVFTAFCLSLVATGLTFRRVIDRSRVEATFTPHPDMRTFVDSPAFKLFGLLYEELVDVEHDELPTSENLATLELTADIFWNFFEDTGHGLDLTHAWSGEVQYGDERRVELASESSGFPDPQSEVLTALIRYFYAVRLSHIVFYADQEPYEPDLDKDLWKGYFPAIYVWHLMGVESMSRNADGSISAVLRPRTDLEIALRELNEELEVNVDDGHIHDEPFITRPRAGMFEGLLTPQRR